MIRGTTPTLTFDIGIDTELIKSVWITFSSNPLSGYELFTLELDRFKLEATTIKTTLTQEETLALNPHNIAAKEVYIQGRVLTTDNTAMASPIIKVTVESLLKEGIIE